jgi:hypothetical protein
MRGRVDILFMRVGIDSIWELFKTRLVRSIETNVPSTMLTYKHRLPTLCENL